MVSKRTVSPGLMLYIRSCNAVMIGQNSPYKQATFGAHIFLQALLADGGSGGLLLATKTRNRPVAVHCEERQRSPSQRTGFLNEVESKYVA